VIDPQLPPAGLSWAEYLNLWVTDCGGWSPLANQLIHRARIGVEIADDPQTVERGLRRLARRKHLPGGQYGRWMLRYFGFTSPIEQWVKWLGTYHTRFADLPSGLRLELLALWNRPPISESPLACWVYIGLAHAHHSRLDDEACASWLARAEGPSHAAGPAAEIEIALLRAQVAIERGDYSTLDDLHRRVEERLPRVEDRMPLRARLLHQRAERCTRSEPLDLVRARDHYHAIPDTDVPFVVFRKAVGLAYCAWKLGDTPAALRLAQQAIDAAGDGGLVRMRVMALNMLSRVLPPEQAAIVNERARRMAAALEDEDLIRRVAHCAP
jgi:hypothetical protein